MIAPAPASTASDRQHDVLQAIFSLFLGLMVLAFIGVAVNTFYPSPAELHEQQKRDLQQQVDALKLATSGRSLDTAQQAEMDRLVAEQNALQRTIDAETEGWARVTSVILVAFATLVMGVSLVRGEQLRVIGNGLLLGGLFTMIYGVGWVVFSGRSIIRFTVLAFALAVAIGLGWLKFVRGRRPVGPVGAVPADEPALAGLAARVAALEERAAAAAVALGGPRDSTREERAAPVERVHEP